jgi:hypothetical protein
MGSGVLRTTTHSKGHFIGGINLLMRKPSGDIKKVPGVRCFVKLPSLAPANVYEEPLRT